ncbi:WW domain-containing protein [Mycena indigotica]|uniref:WW domain-containing protein n=1 Tax=Mycena indigotica TaxID=2126181 RepID=A0A8H6S4Y8_9AGAR|nr:WW domain-containing protein [Mycena indigotica]KAF7292984.1 WW domain-containing protein [Mycena indigotica]
MSKSGTPERDEQDTQATTAEGSSSSEVPKTSEASQSEAKSETETETGAETQGSPSDAAATSSTPWQAIYSPQHNAYYFYNTETQETTWTNPLQPTPTAEASTSQEQVAAQQLGLTPNIDPRYATMQTAALAQGIDPALAYLDPSLAASGSAGLPAGSFQARFNARTGQFTAMDGRTPDHMSEYERAKRMSTVFFDVDAWERSVAAEKAAEDEAGGKKRKRPSKKDLERFKEQKRLKKIAKTAWLRT